MVKCSFFCGKVSAYTGLRLEILGQKIYYKCCLAITNHYKWSKNIYYHLNYYKCCLDITNHLKFVVLCKSLCFN
jgi:hypothetical protein